ncbi:unnamed protein product [Phytophthora lilii]|uniref:Unnamed protein product n=1 Tax=Phytophthora lilii TaxID=2077276 RepID=A0A9W7DA50_9STRA|nr:unnamed protein product [Phytophthora lilii]
MPAQDARVLDAPSASESSDEDEALHVMDPSDPRAHRPRETVARTRARAAPASRWDSDDDDVGEPISAADSENQKTNQSHGVIAIDDAEPTVAPARRPVTLSKWAQARFLVPASQRKTPVLEEPPLEPLNDFILSDFGSRFRGDAGDVQVEKDIRLDDEPEPDNGDKLQVGAPLFDSSSATQDKEDGEEDSKEKKSKKKNKADGRKRKENSNRTLNIDPCGICGRAGHIEEDCDNVRNQERVTCMVCTKVGHLHCVPVPPPADRRVFCPNCGKNHRLDSCHTYREPAATNFATRTASGRTVQTCFVCNEAGHIAAECPVRSNGYGRGGGNCFKCGEPGHFAADCYNSNSRGNSGRRVTGRKRGRDVEDEYPDYNGFDYDEDEDYYARDGSYKGGKKSRYGGGSSRSRKSSGYQGYARLNEALPTRPYRSKNNSYGERKQYSRR